MKEGGVERGMGKEEGGGERGQGAVEERQR